MIYTAILSACMLILALNQKIIDAAPLNDVHKCPICSEEEVARCPAIESSEDCELVFEPNCGCCKMCARREGETCGVATGICGKRLFCTPSLESDSDIYDKFMEAYLGQFICTTPEKLEQSFPGLLEMIQNYSAPQSTPTTENPASTRPTKLSSSRRKHQRHKKVPNSPYSTVAEEPCFQHFDMVWNKRVFARHEWIPDCNKNGLFTPLQCELSFGLRRGRCWCAQPNGKAASTKFIASNRLSHCTHMVNNVHAD